MQKTPKFAPPDGFQKALRQRVDDYFERSGKRRRDCPQMYLKTFVILAWFAASYALLVFGPASWWLTPLATISAGMAVAAVGFNIQHDGAHHAFSDRRWVNKLAALTLDVFGGSSYIWARKHNSFHHSYTNIAGHDDDINVGFLGRLAPHQHRYGFHRLQHLYMWFLYCWLPVKWHLLDDFIDVLRGRIGEHKIARPRGADLAVLILGKTIFFSIALAVPMLFHPPLLVIAFYLMASGVTGLVLSVVFQMAHCVEEAEFPLPRESGHIENDWAVHQVETTVDFAPRNRLLSWYVGGLNFQVEHHLFPQICHLHYAALAPIVEQTCRDYGVRYAAHPTFRGALASHFRWLRRMGLPESKPTLAAAA